MHCVIIFEPKNHVDTQAHCHVFEITDWRSLSNGICTKIFGAFPVPIKCTCLQCSQPEEVPAVGDTRKYWMSLPRILRMGNIPVTDEPGSESAKEVAFLDAREIWARDGAYSVTLFLFN